MPTRPAGYLWLKEKYKLFDYTLTHNSYIGSNASIELTSKGSIDQVYGVKYAPKEDIPLLHLEFGRHLALCLYIRLKMEMGGCTFFDS